jgi:hypothetical protein
MIEGEEKFPGVSSATIFYVEDRQVYHIRQEKLLLEQGIILVGVGGGRFDEHPLKGKREPGICAATLVANYLGVRSDPRWEKLLNYVAKEDEEGSNDRYDLAAIVKRQGERYKENPSKLVEWVFDLIDGELAHQMGFQTEAREEFHQKAVIQEVTLGSRILKVVSIESDGESVSAFARSRLGCQAAVVIQRRSSGNIQISLNPYYQLDPREIRRIIRLEEMRAESSLASVLETIPLKLLWRKLEEEGGVGTKKWHCMPNFILNGSRTAKVEPTSLSLQKVTELVVLALSSGSYEPLRAPRCRERHCQSNRRNQCPWYDYGLWRCRGVRAEQYK